MIEHFGRQRPLRLESPMGDASAGGRLTPPQGKWERTKGMFGPEFVQMGEVDPATGVQRIWKKMMDGKAQTIVRTDRFPDGEKKHERWIMDSTKGPSGNYTMWTLINRVDDEDKYLQYAEEAGKSSPLIVDTTLEAAQRPAFLNLAEAQTIYDANGRMSHTLFRFESQSYIDEEAIKGKAVVDNIRELAGIFKDTEGGKPSLMRFGKEETTAEQAAAIQEMVVASLIRGKLQRWTEEEKAAVDQELGFLAEIVGASVNDLLDQTQAQALFDFLSTETLRLLPEEYVKLSGDEQEEAFRKAVEEAIVTAFRIHDQSIKSLDEHTIVFHRTQNTDYYAFMVFQGNQMEGHIPTPKKLIDSAFGSPKSVFTYEDREFPVFEIEGTFGMLIKSKFNKKDAIYYGCELQVEMDKVMGDIKTDSLSDWQNAFDKAPTRLKVIPHPDLPQTEES